MKALSTEELAQVSGGRAPHHAQQQSWNPFGFLGDIYKNVVFHFASSIGGNKLATAMYGRHTTGADRARAQAAMHKFLVAGHKLPKGVPNLFG